MSCSPFDLKDFFLKELPVPQALQVEAHVRDCPACREDLDRLRLTETALLALREEEIPRRIAFVSGPVFEPSGWRRWWAAFWGSAPRLGFASAAMLSVAILVFAVTRPAAGPASVREASGPALASISSPATQTRIQNAVDKAMIEGEAPNASQDQKLVAEFLRGAEENRAHLAEAANYIEYLQRRNGGLLAAVYRKSSAQGEAQ
jgi:anti-sigma factor RsiW